MSVNYCSCGFAIGDPRVTRHSILCASKRVEELEAVAEAAEKYINRANIGSAADELVVMLDALRAAGYLND